MLLYFENITMEININEFKERLEKLVVNYTRKKYKMNFYEFIEDINVLLVKMKSNFCLRSERDEEGEEDDNWNTHIIAIEISNLISCMNKHKIQIKNMLSNKKYKRNLIVKNYKDFYI